LTRTRRRYRRGYPLAILVGLEERRAVLWRVFSEVAKLDGAVEHTGEGGMYDYHESIVNTLRPALKEGIKSIVVAAPARTDYARNLLDHIRKHHAWLVRGGSNAATFGELFGSASQLHEVHELVRTKGFHEVIGETTSRDAESIVAVLEKSLYSDDSSMIVSYSLEEIEGLVYGRHGQGRPKPEHIVATDRYLADTKNKGRIMKLLQVSKNKSIKTTIVSNETAAGRRLGQLGGLVCFARQEEEKRG